MSTEDPNSFLFEFDILCRTYNYVNDAQKLKLFPATLKNSALKWFMGLGESTIRSWDEMKSSFLRNIRKIVDLWAFIMIFSKCSNKKM